MNKEIKESKTGKNPFPESIKNLPHIDVPFEGVLGHLLQGEQQQMVFLFFEKDTEIPPHHHEDQWEIVLEGMVDLNMNEKSQRYRRGDRFFIPSGIRHSAMVHAGYSAIVFFNEKNRYSIIP